MIKSIARPFTHLWFRDLKESPVFINDTAVRIRAGLLLIIPIYMLYTLIDVVFGTTWLVDGNTAVDSYDTDWDGNIIYTVNAVKRTYDYTFQTYVLFYGLFEMIAGMSVYLSRLSPTILIASILAQGRPEVWKPLVPKRFAWTLGASFIVLCILFFNPDTFAVWLNGVVGSQVLPETYNYMSYYIPMILVWLCLGFMWLETVLGFCVGCQIHALLVKLKIIDEPCEACNNIDWDAIAKRHAEKQAKEALDAEKSPS